MKTKKNLFSMLLTIVVTLPLLACKNPAKSASFTIKAGALVEVMYIDASSQVTNKVEGLLPAFSKNVSSIGGEVLAKFKVSNLANTKRKMTHIVLLQWSDISKRTNLQGQDTFKKLLEAVGKENIQFGFFGAQQDTPVTLQADKIYDFTSAWFITDDPCAFPPLFQVLGGYFQKINPITKAYGISQTAFFGPHPAMPKEPNAFIPHMFGIFEWQKYEDREVFNNDPKYTAHVDVRNAVLKEMDVIFAKLML
ncbi:hypothetical protein [Aquimarina sp. 2304DJ70-9]|uniref:hypothetical protein n=1 Tax=Aquimarina penaris TaxID=3231044 RepID=UPI0034622665